MYPMMATQFSRGLEILFAACKNNLRSSNDALFLYVHNNLINHGFKCSGVGEEGSWEKRSELLPEGWNDSADEYILKYVQQSDNTRHLLKILVVDGTFLIHFMRVLNERAACITVKVSQFTNQVFSEYESAYKDLADLEKQIELELLKELNGRSEFEEQSSGSRRQQRPNPDDDVDPLRVGPPRRGPHNFIPHGDPNNPFDIGRGDRDPFGRGPPGMFMDPFHGQPHFGFDPNAGIQGPERLPRGAVPPGARFDPFGPPGGGMGPGPDNRFRAGPDPDHERPPDFDDMFM